MPITELFAGEEIESPVEIEDAESGATEIEAGEVETPDPQSQPEDAFTGKFKLEDLDPALQGVYKELQADYTRKTQQVAEMRKAFEADPLYSTLKQVQELAQTNPAQLAVWLAEQAEIARQMAGDGQQQAAPEEQEIDPDYLTESERLLWQQNQSLRAELKKISDQLQGITPTVEQARMERAKAQLDAKFGEIEGELGRKLTMEDRNAISEVAMSMGVRDLNGIAAAAKAWDYDNALKRGREQASKIVEQKRQVATGGRAVSPSGGNRPTGPMSIREMAELAAQGKLQ